MTDTSGAPPPCTVCVYIYICVSEPWFRLLAPAECNRTARSVFTTRRVLRVHAQRQLERVGLAPSRRTFFNYIRSCQHAYAYEYGMSARHDPLSDLAALVDGLAAPQETHTAPRLLAAGMPWCLLSPRARGCSRIDNEGKSSTFQSIARATIDMAHTTPHGVCRERPGTSQRRSRRTFQFGREAPHV